MAIEAHHDAGPAAVKRDEKNGALQWDLTGARPADSDAIIRRFYDILRREVLDGNPYLDGAQQERLRSHYPVMNAPRRYPPALVTTIYAQRRGPLVRSILEATEPRVFDAGCGYGSESYLFAALGAKVLAVDLEDDRITIARRRQAYYEELFGCPLDITFGARDLNIYDPELRDLSLTWMGSVLACLPDQDGLFSRLYEATRPGGEVTISDMNLLNPLFMVKEWLRRQRAAESSPEFAEAQDFIAMFWRHQRRGALYYPNADGDFFDDSQFFWPKTLGELFRRTGFEPQKPFFSGFVPPLPGGFDFSFLEKLLDHVPLVRRGAYFYNLTARRPESADGDI